MTVATLKFARRKIFLNKRNLILLVLILLIGGILILSVGRVFLLRVKAVLSPDYYGRVERIRNAEVALELFKNNPFWGVGIGGFSVFAPEIEGVKERFKYPHNILLEVVCELGLLGLFFFGALVILTLKQLSHLRRRWRYSKFHPLACVLTTVFVFCLLSSFTSGDINNPLIQR